MKFNKEIKNYFGFTEQEVFWLMINTGLEYIDSIAGWTESGKKALKENKIFWNWFVKHWQKLDTVLAHKLYHERQLCRMKKEEYKQYHLFNIGHNRFPMYFWLQLKSEAAAEHLKNTLKGIL